MSLVAKKERKKRKKKPRKRSWKKKSFVYHVKGYRERKNIGKNIMILS